MRLAWLLAFAGCFLHRHEPETPRVPAPLAVETAAPDDPAACTAHVPAIVRDARWAPTTSGGLELVDVRGEPRLSTDKQAMVAWAPDSSRLAVADRGAIAVWRASDAALVALVRYPGGDLQVARAAWSRDDRIVLDGSRTHGSRTEGARVIVDLAATPPRAREVGSTPPSPADLAGKGVLVRRSPRGDAIELVDASSGAVRPLATIGNALSAMVVADGGTRLELAHDHELDVYALPAGTLVRRVPLPGAENYALSPDGRRVAGWTLTRVEFLGERAGQRPVPPRPLPPQFLAVWDVATGRQLWRDPTRYGDGWVFSPGGEWLEAPWGRLSSELLRADTGRAASFPGELLPVSPDDRLVPVATGDGLALWSTAGKPVVTPERTPDVLARSAGAMVEHLAAPTSLSRGITIDLGTGGEVLVAGDRCTTVFASRRARDGSAFAFSRDGSRLYAARWSAVDSEAALVDVADGHALHVLRAQASHRIVPMPQAGTFAFQVAAGMRIFDAATGRPRLVAPAPRVSYSRGGPLVWDVRDPDGDRTSGFGELAPAPDGRSLIGTTELQGPVVTTWNLADPRATIDRPVPDSVRALVVSPDGTRIVAGGRDGGVLEWIGTTSGPRTLATAGGEILALAFSPDSRVVAAGGDDGTVIVVDAATGVVRGSARLVFDRPLLLTWIDDHTLIADTARHLAITWKLR